jgi:hypothetical protein
MNETSIVMPAQQEICSRFGAKPVAPDPLSKLGIAPNVRDGILPINGLRHPAEADTCGWYVWTGGDIPQSDSEFFVPLHVAHLVEWCPDVIPYLALPPGWRFQIAPGHVDVWFDESLLNLEK